MAAPPPLSIQLASGTIRSDIDVAFIFPDHVQYLLVDKYCSSWAADTCRLWNYTWHISCPCRKDYDCITIGIIETCLSASVSSCRFAMVLGLDDIDTSCVSSSIRRSFPGAASWRTRSQTQVTFLPELSAAVRSVCSGQYALMYTPQVCTEKMWSYRLPGCLDQLLASRQRGMKHVFVESRQVKTTAENHCITMAIFLPSNPCEIRGWQVP